MFRIYLAGGMAGRLAEVVKAERDLAVAEFAKAGIHAVDPGAAEKKLWADGKKSKISDTPPKEVMEAFVRQDLWLVRHCDALLVLTGDTPSDGTWREMCYAERIGIPVIMIAPKRESGRLMTWSTVLVPDLVPDLGSAVKLVKDKYSKQFKKQRNFFNSAIKNAKKSIAFNEKKKRKKK